MAGPASPPHHRHNREVPFEHTGHSHRAARRQHRTAAYAPGRYGLAALARGTPRSRPVRSRVRACRSGRRAWSRARPPPGWSSPAAASPPPRRRRTPGPEAGGPLAGPRRTWRGLH